MKKTFAIIAALLVGAMMGQAKEVSYLPEIRITGETLEKEGREVTLKMDLDLTELRMKTQHTMSVTPVLVSKDGTKEVEFPPVVIDGKTRDKIYLRSQTLESVAVPPMHDDNAKVIMRRNNRKEQSYSYESTLPYERWMLDGRVELREKVYGCVNCGQGESTESLIGGIIPEFFAEYRLGGIEPEPEPIKVREESRAARIQFKWDRYEILPNFMNNRAELDTVTNSILLVKNNPDVTITAVYIDGYASPEGTIPHNELLSKNRAYSLADYIHRNVKVDNSLLHVSWHGEDWEGFKRQMLVENRLPGMPQRDEVVRLIKEGAENNDIIEKKISELQPTEQIFRAILGTLYPELRRNEYRIVYDVRNFDLEEAREMILKRPDLLSLKEMYMVAGSYAKGSPEYQRTMDIAAENYPNSPAVVSDLSLDLMAEKKYKEAAKLLEDSALTKDNPVLLNTLGVAYANLNEPYKAEAAFEPAAKAGNAEAVHNLEQVRKIIDQL